MSGKSFELVHTPSLRADTYLHLNREGETWAVRWYPSPSEPAVELGRSSRPGLDLSKTKIVDSIPYPYSHAAGGVSVRDSKYWFNEIQKANKRLPSVTS